MNILYVSQYFSFSPTHAAAVTTREIIKRLIQNLQNPVNVSSETQQKIKQAMKDYGVSSLSELLEMLMESLSGKEEVKEEKSSK